MSGGDQKRRGHIARTHAAVDTTRGHTAQTNGALETTGGLIAQTNGALETTGGHIAQTRGTPYKLRARITQTRAILRKADELYAPWSCPASGECCQLTKTGRQPWVMPSEWDLLTEWLEQHGRELPPDRADGGCPFLDEAGLRCTVYEARPIGCRTFFCDRIRGPQRQPVEQVDALLRRLTVLNEPSGDDEDNDDPDGHAETLDGRPLLEWVRLARR